MEGFEDPFNRQTYPWGQEDRELLDWFRALGRLRKDHTALRRGAIRYVCGQGPLLAFLREDESEAVLCACNAGEEPVAFDAPLSGALAPLLGRAHVEREEETFRIMVPPRTGVAMELQPAEPENCGSED